MHRLTYYIFPTFGGLLTLLTLLHLSPQPSSAISCFNCVESIDKSCGDPFDNSTATPVDCESLPADQRPFVDAGEHRETFKFGKAVGCRKVIQEIDDKYYIVRQCAFGGEDAHALKRIGNKGVRMFYYQCSGDKCNGAQNIVVTRPAAIAFSFVSIFAFLFSLNVAF